MQPRDGRGDRFCSVDKNLDLCRAGDASEDRVNDCLRLFRPWVVGGDDHQVGELAGNTAHLHTLAAVTVATGAEDDDQATFCQRPRCAQGIL